MTTTETERRKPGRPRSAGRVNCTIQVTPQRYSRHQGRGRRTWPFLLRGSGDATQQSFWQDFERNLMQGTERQLMAAEERLAATQKLLDQAIAEMNKLREENDGLREENAELRSALMAANSETLQGLVEWRLEKIVKDALMEFAKTGRRL